MAHQITIWNPKTELEELTQKVAKLEEDKEVPTHYLLVPKAALKEAGWDESLIEEAINRGRAKAKGEELEDPSWEVADDEVSEAPEVPGLEATEEEQRVPGRVFNLLGDMGREESEEQEEVREDGPEDDIEEPPYAGAGLATRSSDELLEKLFGYKFWDCPECSSVNGKDEEFCPTCGYQRAWYDEGLKKYHEMKGKKMGDDKAILGDAIREYVDVKTHDKNALAKRAKEHLTDSRRRITVGDDTGWLCETCNSVWSLEQQMCPNRCKSAEPPTVEHRAWPEGESPLPKDRVPTLAEYAMAKKAMEENLEEKETGLTADVRFPEEEAGDPLAADPDWLRKHISEHLGGAGGATKEDLATKIKAALGVDHLPGEPIECTICGMDDNEQCNCCYECQSEECICCEYCYTHPCVCDETEVCPICDARFEIGEACPTGCDADHAALLNLYEEVKTSTELNWVDKAKYMALLKEKIRLVEDVEEPDTNPLDEPDAEEDI